MNLTHRGWICASMLLGTALVVCAQPPTTEPRQPEQPPAPSTPPAPVAPGSLPPASPAPQPPVTAPAPDSFKPGATLILFMKDGRVFTGVLESRTDREYILKIAGISTRFNADDVDRVRVQLPPLERYRELRSHLADTNVEGLIDLIEWLLNQGEADAALDETLALRKRFPNNGAVQRLESQVRRQIDLKKNARPPGNGPGTPRPSPADDRPAPATLLTVPMLSAEQINLIKVFEVDLARPPQIIIPREVVGAMLDKYAGHPLAPATREARDAVLRQSGAETLDLMFRLRAREFYPQVRVLDQPESMRRFRDDVHRPIIQNYCATSACHGGTEAGRLVFVTQRPNADPAVYTNFLILERFRTSNSEPLLNWEHPERSIALQMALPRDVSAARHPVVLSGSGAGDAWKPLFKSASERRYEAAVGWMNAMYRPRPEYEIPYTPFRSFTPPAGDQSPGVR